MVPRYAAENRGSTGMERRTPSSSFGSASSSRSRPILGTFESSSSSSASVKSAVACRSGGRVWNVGPFEAVGGEGGMRSGSGSRSESARRRARCLGRSNEENILSNLQMQLSASFHRPVV